LKFRVVGSGSLAGPYLKVKKQQLVPLAVFPFLLLNSSWSLFEVWAAGLLVTTGCM